MTSNHTPGMNYPSHSHGQNDSPFGPIGDGWELLREYTEDCQGCGETYYRRISITPNNMVDNVRTRCACLRAKSLTVSETNPSINTELHSLFWPWNIINNADGYSLDKCVPACLEHEKLIINLKTYVRRFQPSTKGICFYGLAGRGKTHYALCLGKEIKDKGYSVLAIKSIDLLNRLRKCYSSKDINQELQVMKVLKYVDLLIIDDIGIEKPTGWVREKLYEVIDYRHGKGTSIFTTNLGGEDLSLELGQALASRIFGTGYQVKVTGKDRRLTNIEDFSDLGREITDFELEMKD